MEPISLDTIKYILSVTLKVIVVTLAFLFILTKCGGCDSKIVVPKHDNSALFAKMKSDSIKIIKLEEEQKQDSLKTIASKQSEDSIKVVADKYTKLYKNSSKRVRDLLARGICDTVEITIALNNCDSTIESKDRLLAQKDSTYESINEELINVKEQNGILKSEVKTAKTIISNQAEDYKTLEKTSKKELRKQKIKTIGVIVVSALVEALTIFALK
jgi:hypothetical protein